MHEDFNATAIQGDLKAFFNVVYQLEFTIDSETRYRTVTDDDGNEHEEAYTYTIYNTKLTVADWDTVIAPYLESKSGERAYDEYIGTGGNHQMFGSPMNFNWTTHITCPYGNRPNPTGVATGLENDDGSQMHTGLDIGAGIGTPIYSIMDGTVTVATSHDLYGNYIDIIDSNGNKSRYAHCDRLLVTVGQTVKRGQVIAEVGKTGNVTGPHLHIEIFVNGVRVNPIFLMQPQPKKDDTESEG